MSPNVTARELAFGSRSPSGNWPYLAMLHAYMDESGWESGPLCVVAGFVGSEQQWSGVESDWIGILAKWHRKSLHMNRLRWGGKWMGRTGKLLSALGPIPHNHNLRPIMGMIDRSAFDTHMQLDHAGVISPLFMSFRMVLMHLAVWMAQPYMANETLKISFERQDKVSPAILNTWGLLLKNHKKLTNRIVGLDFIEKGNTCCLEPADYLAFEYREYFSNKANPSEKAKLGLSIMGDLEKPNLIGGEYKIEELIAMRRDLNTRYLIQQSRTHQYGGFRK
jgi:hypothetical protein